jgi:RNA polymerase sigma factor (sigma-70 family)
LHALARFGHRRRYTIENMTETQALLAEFVKSRSETAFRELVARYLNLVYSTAFRLTGGDAHRAQDVAQSVFLHLARKAHMLKSDSTLGGWLHRDTCHVAATLMRGERRRQQRELQAAAMNSAPDHSEANLAALTPVLDEAINQLGEIDRAAIVLRFYEQRDLRSVGEALGSSENAAQKRVTRALDTLRVLLKQRGIALSAAALASMLTAEAVTAAPAGMITTISTSALAGAAKTSGTTVTILKLMAAAKIKTAVVGTILLAGVMAPFIVQERSNASLRDQDESLRAQAAQIAQLKVENDQLAAFVHNFKVSRRVADSRLRAILKLRAEVAALQRGVADLKNSRSAAAPSTPLSPDEKLALLKSKYAEQVGRLKDWLESHPSERIPELDSVPDHDWIDAVQTLSKDDDFESAMSSLRRYAEARVFQNLRTALRSYVRDNSNAFPTDLSQLRPYLKTPVDDAVLQRYQITASSNLVPELQEAGETVITQIAAVNAALDSRVACGLNSKGQVRETYADVTVTNRWNLVH